MPSIVFNSKWDGSQVEDGLRRTKAHLKEIAHESHVAASVFGGEALSKYAKFGAMAAGGLGIATGVTIAVAGIEKLVDAVKESNKAWQEHIETVYKVGEAYNLSYGESSKFIEKTKANIPKNSGEKESDYNTRVTKSVLEFNKAFEKIIDEARNKPESATAKTLSSIGLTTDKLAPGQQGNQIEVLEKALEKMDLGEQYSLLTKLFKDQGAAFRDILSPVGKSPTAEREKAVKEEIEKLKEKYTVFPTGGEPEPTLPHLSKSKREIEAEARGIVSEKEEKELQNLKAKALLEQDLEESAIKLKEKQDEQLSDQYRLNILVEKRKKLEEDIASMPIDQTLERLINEKQILDLKEKELPLQKKIEEDNKKHEDKEFESSFLNKSKEAQISTIMQKMMEERRKMETLPMGSKEQLEARDSYEKYRDQGTKLERERAKTQFELDTRSKDKAFQMTSREFSERARGSALVGGFAGTGVGGTQDIGRETNNILRMIHRTLLQRYYDTTFNLDAFSLH